MRRLFWRPMDTPMDTPNLDAAATSPATPASSSVIEVTAQNFEREVLARSMEVPVLVDFWAPWCGPCKTLGPILEKLAKELEGRFVLAKVDTEKETELAAAFQIQSIPTVLLLVGGRPADGFMGALPEAQVRAFLEPHLGEAPPPEAAASPLEQARALEAEGNRNGAVVHLLEFLRGAPAGEGQGPVRVELARMLLEESRATEVPAVVAELSEADWATEAGQALRARLDFADRSGDVDELRAKAAASPGDLDARLALGRALVAANLYEEGLEELLSVAKQDLKYDDGAPRKALLEVFELLGYEDPLTLEFQKRLSHLLCL